MQLVQHWWNGRWGRLARRDIWLEEHAVWRVRVRQGDGDSKTTTYTFDTRKEADDLVQQLRDAPPGDRWRDLTAPPPSRQAIRPPDWQPGPIDPSRSRPGGE